MVITIHFCIIAQNINLADTFDRVQHITFFYVQSYLFPGMSHFKSRLLDFHRYILRCFQPAHNPFSTLFAHLQDSASHCLIHLKQIIICNGICQHSSQIISFCKQLRRPLAYFSSHRVNPVKSLISAYTAYFLYTISKRAELKNRCRTDFFVCLREHFFQFFYNLFI